MLFWGCAPWGVWGERLAGTLVPCACWAPGLEEKWQWDACYIYIYISIILDSNDKPIEEHFLEVLYKKMDKNSLLVIPSSMEQYVNISNINNDELGSNGQIKHIGDSNGRPVYSVNTEEINALKGFKNGVIWINSGNQFILNPTKPIVFFNTIENPYLKRPILYVTSMGDFKFKKDSCTVMYVEDLDD